MKPTRWQTKNRGKLRSSLPPLLLTHVRRRAGTCLAQPACHRAATWASGPLFNAYAGGAYVAMAVIATVALLAALVIRARWDGGTL